MSGFIGKDKFHNFRLWTKDAEIIRTADWLRKSLDLGDRLLKEKTEFIVNLMINLKISSRNNNPLLISRAQTFYNGVPRENIPDYQTYTVVTKTLDALKANGYVSERPAILNRRRTGYSATEKMLSLISQLEYKTIEVQRPKTFIILRKEKDGEKVDIEYKSYLFAPRLHKDMVMYNNLRESTKISFEKLPVSLFNLYKNTIQDFAIEDVNKLIPVNSEYKINLKTTYMVRIFNDKPTIGGRFYWSMESVLKNELRAELYINGKPTIELDYKSLHPRMLYDLRQIKLASNFDPYEVRANLTKDQRSAYKRLFLIMINAKDELGAINAFGYKIREDDELFKTVGDNKYKTKLRMVDELIAHNKRIGDDLFTEKCHELTNKDSNMANEILRHFAKNGILVLCIHDSFVIEEPYEVELREKMEDVYKAKFGNSPIIEKK